MNFVARVNTRQHKITQNQTGKCKNDHRKEHDINELLAEFFLVIIIDGNVFEHSYVVHYQIRSFNLFSLFSIIALENKSTAPHVSVMHSIFHIS